MKTTKNLVLVQWKYIVLITLLSVLMMEDLFSLQLKDTSEIRKDSTKIYKSIEKFSTKSKYTRFLHGLLFRKIPTDSPQVKQKKTIEKSTKKFEDKIIRHIHIKTIDPFGYSVKDTSVMPKTFMPKAGNSLHIKTRSFTIRNLLLIRQNMPFDSLLVKESIRLLRTMNYIHDVSIAIKQASTSPDSVDIFINVLDKWSIIPRVNNSSSQSEISLRDRNFSGLGHELSGSSFWYSNPSRFAYNVNYLVPNIRNTYISGMFYYGRDGFGHFNRAFSLNRPFFSAYAKWAGGINFIQQSNVDSFQLNSFPFQQLFYRYNSQDFWIGYSFRLFKGSEYKQVTNFITALRFYRNNFLETPANAADMNNKYYNENIYFVKFGISSRRYELEKYIFEYGLTEDVPIGKVYSITAGYQQYRNRFHRLYFGNRIAYGRFFHWGYLSTNFEFGTFFRNSKAEQGIFSGEVDYFTGLQALGKWRFRQFIKSHVALGINRFMYDSLTLNGDYGLVSFNSKGLIGNKRIVVSLQSQSYTPWNIIGFRFGPFVNLTVGMLGNQETGFRNSKLYTQVGFGVLIKNENLIINTFQISISFFPVIPGVGSNILKINSFKTSDFGLRDFQINEPGVVLYR